MDKLNLPQSFEDIRRELVKIIRWKYPELDVGKFSRIG